MRRGIELDGIGPLENGAGGLDSSRSRRSTRPLISPEGFDRFQESLATSIFQMGALTIEEGESGPTLKLDLPALHSREKTKVEFEQAILRAMELTHEPAFTLVPTDPSVEPLAKGLTKRVGFHVLAPKMIASEGGQARAIKRFQQEGQKERAVIISGAIKSGAAEIEAVNAVRKIEVDVDDVVTLIDFEEGAHEALQKKGIDLTSVFTLQELLVFGLRRRLITEAQYEAILFPRMQSS